MHLDFLPIPIWAIVILAIIIVIPTYVMIAGRNAEGGLRGRTSHGWSRWREGQNSWPFWFEMSEPGWQVSVFSTDGW